MGVVGASELFVVQAGELTERSKNFGEGSCIAFVARHLEAFFTARDEEVLIPVARHLLEVSKAEFQEAQVFVCLRIGKSVAPFDFGEDVAVAEFGVAQHDEFAEELLAIARCVG